MSATISGHADPVTMQGMPTSVISTPDANKDLRTGALLQPDRARAADLPTLSLFRSGLRSAGHCNQLLANHLRMGWSLSNDRA